MQRVRIKSNDLKRASDKADVILNVGVWIEILHLGVEMGG